MRTKRCPKCGETKPRTRRYFVVVKHRGRGRKLLYKHCRVCDRERQRRVRDEIKADPVRRARYAAKHREAQRARYAKDPERRREEQRRWRARLMEDNPEHYVEIVLIPRRFRREGRTYFEQGMETYRAPSKMETLPVGPLRDFILSQFPGWEAHEVAQATGYVLNPDTLRRLLGDKLGNGEVVALDLADRLLTKGLGRPDLLNALYPPEQAL